MIAALTLIASQVALAQQAVNPFDEADESEIFRFEDDLVTVASRYAQTVRKAPSIVTVVSADQIRARGYRTLSDILRELPGIYIWRNQEGRDIASIRGVVSADNNKLLVLVDGQPWYDGIYTHAFIDDFLPIANIRQVEVIKGPGSAIYGTNAFTGVVNVVTWKASDLEGGRMSWTVGSTGRSDLTASAGARSDVGALTTEVTAYARLMNQSGQGLDITPDNKIDIPGVDPKKGYAAGTRLNIEGLELQMHHIDYSHTFLTNEIESPDEALNRTLDSFEFAYHDTFFSAKYAIDLGEDVQLTPSFWSQRHRNPGSYFFGGDGYYKTIDAEKDTRRWGTSVDGQFRFGIDHIMVAGVGLENVSVLRFFDHGVDTNGVEALENGFQVTDDCGQPAGYYRNEEDCQAPGLRNIYAYTQYTWTATPGIELTGGGRFDKRVPMNSLDNAADGVFVPSFSPRLGVLVVPSDRVTGKLLYGRAFRAASVREVLVASDAVGGGDVSYNFTNGNRNLLPEKIQTVEGELVGSVSQGVELRGDGYYSLLQDEIDKVAPLNQYCNLLADLNVVGAEAGFKGTAGPLAVTGSYALTLAKYSSADPPDEDLCPGLAGSADPGAAGNIEGRTQYEFPPHMGKGSASLYITDDLSMTVLGEVYSTRPRAEWSPDAGIVDGRAFGLMHIAGTIEDLGPNDTFRAGFAVRNALDTNWNFGVYRDDANNPSFPAPIQANGRSFTVNVEAKL